MDWVLQCQGPWAWFFGFEGREGALAPSGMTPLRPLLPFLLPILFSTKLVPSACSSCS